MKITLKNLHTMVVFVGISGSGKSTKAKELDTSAKSMGLSSVVISSDDCRRELLCVPKDTFHHHDTEMYQISSKAFKLLRNKIELYLKYPYSAEVVILDMMNLATEDREKLIQMANDYCYDIIAVVLDYSNVEDYFAGLDDRYDRKVIGAQLRRFHTRTLPELGKKRYDNVVRITSKTEHVEFETSFDIDIDKVYLPNAKHSFIVGDIHECIKTFKGLLRKAGFDIEVENGIEKITGRDDTVIIVDGDYIDKGRHPREIIDFLYNNMDRILFVDGNHENFVERWLDTKVEKTKMTSEKMVYYSSIPVLEGDEELRKKFLELRKVTVPFIESKHFIVTHAGCKVKYLGKTQNYALKSQRYYHVDRFEDDDEWLIDRRKNLSYLKDEAEACEPYHIFGHEAFLNNLVYRNKIHIDTGCCHGLKLTGVEINKNTGFYKIWTKSCEDSVPVEYTQAREKIREFVFEQQLELNPGDWSKIKWIASNKVNFISGTMCPADKSGVELECLDKALEYFKNRKIDKVMLQIKYMGSRCNIYLFDDYTKSYAITRNGNLIKKVDMTNIYKKLRERPAISNYFKENNLELMIIDGELMPWSALGEGLIESIFQTIDIGVKSELELLSKNGFEEQLAKLTNKYTESGFDSDRRTMKKEDLYNKYGPQKYEAYKLLTDFYMPPVEELKKHHEIYRKQLDNYAVPVNNVEYQAFSILKSVKKNGEEIHYFDSDNETLFKMVNDAPYYICDLVNDTYEPAKQFFDTVTDTLNLEGIVIKPLKVDSQCAPYIKVRSPKYLTIIYGYDYLDIVKYNQLLEQKRTRLKMEMSIKEWILGKKLLQIPYKDISIDNKKYVDLMTKMLVEIEKEEDLDPRL